MAARPLPIIAIVLTLLPGVALAQQPKTQFAAGVRLPFAAAPHEFSSIFDPGIGFELGFYWDLSPTLALTAGLDADLLPVDGEKVLRDAGRSGGSIPAPEETATDHRLLLGLRRAFGHGGWRPYARAAAGLSVKRVPRYTFSPSSFGSDIETKTGLAVVAGGGATWHASANAPGVSLGVEYETGFGKVADADVVALRMGLQYARVPLADVEPDTTGGGKKQRRWFLSLGMNTASGSGSFGSDYLSGLSFGGGWELSWSDRFSGLIQVHYGTFGFDENGFRDAHGFAPGSTVEGNNASALDLLFTMRGYAAPSAARAPYLEAGFGRVSTSISYSASEPNHLEVASTASGATALFGAAGLRMSRGGARPFVEASALWFMPDDQFRDDALIARLQVGAFIR